MTSLRIDENTLYYGTLKLDFPAVRLSIGGKIYEPHGAAQISGPLARGYSVDGIQFFIRVKPLSGGGWRKQVSIKSSRSLATPDWVELDRQTVPDPTVIQRGYKATEAPEDSIKNDEDGSALGIIPCCGYPLIGTHFFAGVEHPAAFANLEQVSAKNVSYSLVQHPVWDENGCLNLADAVVGWFENAEQSFFDYLRTIRLPARTAPFFSMCTFWSDPYVGNFEYQGDPENYRSFIKAFTDAGIVPDVFLLDVGWQNRKSILEPKPVFQGFFGIQKLSAYAKRWKSSLGLWVSHNGPIGICPEYLKSAGLPVGRGNSSSYGGNMDFGVLLDKNLENAVGSRLADYARLGIRHLKIDWDNDCAVNADFQKQYPTQNHVREGSINAMIRIVKRIRKENQEILLRNGWWPSPWWLMYVNHVFLSDSNDSEYTSLPSRTQKDSAATYRDTIYYCSFQRDRSAFPLEAIDNHEFSHALRNPFHEIPGTAADLMMLAVMRGSSYFPLTLQPEALEPWYFRLLSEMMRFARACGEKLYSSRPSMFGGNPNSGEIYGFRYEQKNGSAWCVLRNPSAMPKTYIWTDEIRSGVWIYPYFSRYQTGSVIEFLPHEVKLIILSRKNLRLPFEESFQIVDGDHFYFPAHRTVQNIAPAVRENYRINDIEYECEKLAEIEGGLEVMFRLRLPYRMRRTTINIEIYTEQPEQIRVSARSSRCPCDDFSCCQLSVTRFSEGLPGIGEKKNPDVVSPVKGAYFAVPCAEGGEAWYSLFIFGVRDWDQVKLSVSGYFAPSLHSLQKKWHPSWLLEFPPAHPDGFPVMRMLKIEQNSMKGK